jgi:hypothetical protein
LGRYIIKCEKMLAGPVAFEEVSARYRQTMVNQRKEYAWSELGQKWIDEAISDGSLKQYMERI